jgi:predicted nucleic acid-binding protein
VAQLPEVIVDASVVCKWFVTEPDSEAALRVRDAHTDARIRLVAPALICYEVLNALRYHPSISDSDLRESARELIEIQLTLVPPSAQMLGVATGYARTKKLTLYDACYVSLAETRECTLVSADQRLLGACDRAVPLLKWTQSR